MYTRCPECHTPFRITRAQLDARAGWVRCGKCDAIFLATEQLLDAPPASADDPVDEVSKKPPRRSESKRRRRKSSSRDARPATTDGTVPTVSELPFARKRRRLHPLLGGSLNLALFLLLTAQVMYFYRDDIVQVAELRPAIGEFCRVLGCEFAPTPPLPPPELRETSIAPHPRFANALRIRAVMVNRNAQAQAYPLMEVRLTDSGGAVVARRTFEPRDYLAQPPPGRLEPNIAVNTLIDVTNPDGKAVGYEIQLLAADENQPNN